MTLLLFILLGSAALTAAWKYLVAGTADIQRAANAAVPLAVITLLWVLNILRLTCAYLQS